MAWQFPEMLLSDAATRHSIDARSRLRPDIRRNAERAALLRQDFVVPVATPDAPAYAAGPDALMDVRIDAVRFKQFEVRVTDTIAAESMLDGAAVSLDMATRHAVNHALQHDVALLDTLPVSASRDQIMAATRYSFYGQERTPETVQVEAAQAAADAAECLRTSFSQITEACSVAADAMTGCGTAVAEASRQIARHFEDQMATVLYTYGTGTLYTQDETPIGASYQTNWTTANMASTSNVFTVPIHYYANTIGTACTAATAGNLSNLVFSSNWDWTTPIPDTPEQKAARAAREAKLVVVRARANRLFMAHLSEAQRRTWEEHRHLDMLAPSGRRYRLKKFWSANVFLLDAQGREVRKYCAYANDPGGMLPEGDHWYLQLLALQYDERSFLRAANTWRMTGMTAMAWEFAGQGVDADAPDVPLVMAA